MWISNNSPIPNKRDWLSASQERMGPMTFPSPIDAIASWSRDELLSHQWVRMTQCWPSWKSNPFYQSILPKSLADWNAWENVPVTTKSQLIDDQDALGLGRHHTWPADHYTRFHRTSGTTGRPLVILDTAEDWNWWVSTWQYTLASAEVTADDRVFMAFSFGPFIGFWSAHDACLRRNAMVIPGGGLSSLARLDLIRSSHATIVCCTPSYALHLAEVAKQHRFPLRDLQVRQLIVAGEPGGSSPEVRQRIQSAWNANVTDHAGGTEIGPWGFGTQDGKGLYVIETEFLAEFLPLDGSSKPLRIDSIQPDELYELVLTPFGRLGSPSYDTGPGTSSVHASIPFFPSFDWKGACWGEPTICSSFAASTYSLRVSNAFSFHFLLWKSFVSSLPSRANSMKSELRSKILSYLLRRSPRKFN